MNEALYSQSEPRGVYAHDKLGEVYIIHLHTPLGHARHYVGFTKHLDKRLAHHRANSGARFLQVCNELKISYTLVVRFAGTKTDERRLKNTNNTSRYCPYCNPKPQIFKARVLPHERTYHHVEL
jgi:predicted GIY-YIG superfamily endonuclease